LREFVLDAGPIRYGAGLAASYRRVGHYAAGKLKGENPAGRLVEQATFSNQPLSANEGASSLDRSGRMGWAR